MIGQLASIVLGIEDDQEDDQEDQEHRGTIQKVLRILKGREGEQGRIPIEFNVIRSQIEEIVEDVSMEGSGQW